MPAGLPACCPLVPQLIVPDATPWQYCVTEFNHLLPRNEWKVHERLEVPGGTLRSFPTPKLVCRAKCRESYSGFPSGVKPAPRTELAGFAAYTIDRKSGADSPVKGHRRGRSRRRG